jgi:hypothetical protein
VKTRPKPAYFENQKQCAAALGLDVRELREWKAENCPAFRFSRIYHAELLDWIKNKKKAVTRRASATKPEQNEPSRAHWDRERARVEYERVEFNLAVQQRKYLKRDEVLSALGQMLAAFTASCRDFPARTARWLVGLKDQHQIQNKLQSEMDAMLSMFNQGRFLDSDIIPAVVEKLFADRTPEFRADLSKSCWQVFIEIGRQCFEQLQIKVDPQ